MVLPDLNSTPPGGEEDVHMSEEEEDVHMPEGEEDVRIPRAKPDLPDTHKFAAYIALKALSRDGEIDKRDKERVAGLLNTSVRTVERIWKEANAQLARGEEINVSNKRKRRCGRKRADLDLSRIPSIPLNKRSTLRALARSLDVPYSTLRRRFKWGKIRKHTNSLKPTLKPENKLSRLKFCISMIDQTTIADAMPSFIDMQNIVHIDEKWFDMTKRNRTYYLHEEEPDPVRTVQNKNSIGKVMFLTAVARPRFDDQGNVTFDGKIGVWAFIKETPAKKDSKNRLKGTKELKSVTVTRNVMREYLCEKVIPAIEAQWPEDNRTIYIQQDNARTHVPPDDSDFLAAVAESELDIRLMQQPANSPDMNVLDLCFFSSIQSLTLESAPNNIKELIESVEEAYDRYEVHKLARVFITLQSVLIEVMRVEGGTGYKIPHMNKDRMEREGMLHINLRFDAELYWKTLDIIEGH